VDVKLTLALPRDELSIPVVRRILSAAMAVLGVERDCIDEVAVAVTEACANVLEHAAEGAAYEVSVGVEDDLCVIEVVDTGGGFDPTSIGMSTAEVSAEQGRGIHLMRQMVDRVRFDSRPEKGTVVHLEKRLHWRDGAPIERLSINGMGPAGTRQSAPDPLG
jgi:serine/threonine-protein kinase RsbW